MDWDIILSEDEIQNRLYELAKQIDDDYKGKEITVIIVMRGAMYFAVNLTMKMKSKLRLEFVYLKSYDGEETTGKVEMDAKFRDSLEGKDILIIEDLVDTGTTMEFFFNYLKTQNPASVKLCTLVHKNKKSKFNIPIDYNGFNIEDKFIVGFGLDYNNSYRNLPFIADMENSKPKE